MKIKQPATLKSGVGFLDLLRRVALDSFQPPCQVTETTLVIIEMRLVMNTKKLILNLFKNRQRYCGDTWRVQFRQINACHLISQHWEIKGCSINYFNKVIRSWTHVNVNTYLTFLNSSRFGNNVIIPSAYLMWTLTEGTLLKQERSKIEVPLYQKEKSISKNLKIGIIDNGNYDY